MLYRDHRGILADSMATVTEINNMEELRDYLNKSWRFANKKVEEIKIKYYAYDERIDWDTYAVSARLEGEENFWPMGFLNGNLEEE